MPNNTHAGDVPVCGTPAQDAYASGSSYLYVGGRCHVLECYNPFDNLQYLAAGGGVSGNSWATGSTGVNGVAQNSTGISVSSGGTPSAAAFSQVTNDANVVATKGTVAGGGGGAAMHIAWATASGYTSTSAAGNDGFVYIYVQKGN
jgi:hypothetical protein